ncbi:MAG: hypothetical protein ACMUIP_11475 [bacterium]
MRYFSFILIVIVCLIAFPAWPEEQEDADVARIVKIIDIDREANSLTIQAVGEETLEKISLPDDVQFSKQLKKGSILKIWGKDSNEMRKIDVLKGSERFLQDPTGVRSRIRNGAGKRKRGGSKGHRRH